MGILDKVRDFFYDEEDYEEEIKIKPEKHPVKEKKEKKEKKDKIKFIDKTEPKKPLKDEKQNISERELFKAERTFNFPFDVDDDDFAPKEEVKEVKPEIKKEEVKPQVSKVNTAEYKQTKPFSIRNYEKYEKEKKEEQDDKKFKPTPVISPIYGILDKNYKKEDLLIDDKKKNTSDKKLDYETVRKRAYSKTVEKEDDSKGIFFNLDDDNKKEEEVKIVYNDVELDKEEDKNKTIGEKIEEYEKSLEKEPEVSEDTDDDILSETKEQDLFNLIDNMYNSDDDDDEEVD